MKRYLAIAAGVFMFGLGKAQAELKVGQPAPDFTATAVSASGPDAPLQLKSLIGQSPIVLYFYPKDNTPGCTKEACGIRDSFGAFRNLHAKILGVSYDTPESHHKFIDDHNLPFTLLSDKDHQIAKLYGANGMLFAKRMTFVIDKGGNIAFIDPSVDPSKHSQELQDVLQKLQ